MTMVRLSDRTTRESLPWSMLAETRVTSTNPVHRLTIELICAILAFPEYIEVGGKSSQAMELQSALDPGLPVPVVPGGPRGGPLGGQPTHPTNGSPDALTNTSAQKIINAAVDDEEDDTDDDDDDGMEV